MYMLYVWVVILYELGSGLAMEIFSDRQTLIFEGSTNYLRVEFVSFMSYCMIPTSSMQSLEADCKFSNDATLFVTITKLVFLRCSPLSPFIYKLYLPILSLHYTRYEAKVLDEQQ